MTKSSVHGKLRGMELAARRNSALTALLIVLAIVFGMALSAWVVRMVNGGTTLVPCQRCGSACPCPKVPGTLQCLCPR